MTVNELYNGLQIQSPLKILSAYNGRVLCYNFYPEKEEHKKSLGARGRNRRGGKVHRTLRPGRPPEEGDKQRIRK